MNPYYEYAGHENSHNLLSHELGNDLTSNYPVITTESCEAEMLNQTVSFYILNDALNLDEGFFLLELVLGETIYIGDFVKIVPYGNYIFIDIISSDTSDVVLLDNDFINRRSYISAVSVGTSSVVIRDDDTVIHYATLLIRAC